ncbi:MAG: glycosyltransferase [Candidatus Kapabacteria bacterium]|nr:glycosyltransferase [Candidatus Kapabacteria bacterium]
MRILAILSRIPYPPTDGGAILTYNTLKYLHRAGHELRVLALNTKKHHQSPEVLREICTSIQTIDVNTDLTTAGALWSALRGESYITSRFYSKPFEELLLRTLRTTPVDVVHIDHTLVAWYARTIRQHLPERPLVVLRTHNVEYMIQERLAKHETMPLRRWYRRYAAGRMKVFEKRFFAECDSVIAITPEDAAQIRAMGYGGAMEVIPAGVDVRDFAPNPDVSPKPNTICYIGGMDWMPNIEAMQWFVRDVMPLVREKLPDVEFHLAGKRMSPEMLEYGQHQSVFTHPDVPSAPVFMQSHEILVVPLLSGGGMRLKIVEAMALGMPIVSTRIGAEGIAVRDGESILFAETPEEFVEKIGMLLANPVLKKRLGEEARRIALERYTWEGIAAQQIRFYDSLLASKNIPRPA